MSFHNAPSGTGFSADRGFPVVTLPQLRPVASRSTIAGNEEYLMLKLEAIKADREPEYRETYIRNIQKRARERYLVAMSFRWPLEIAPQGWETKKAPEVERMRNIPVNTPGPKRQPLLPDTIGLSRSTRSVSGGYSFFPDTVELGDSRESLIGAHSYHQGIYEPHESKDFLLEDYDGIIPDTVGLGEVRDISVADYNKDDDNNGHFDQEKMRLLSTKRW